MSLPLPPELTISVLSHLPISSFATLCKTSRAWNAFIQTNQSTIYQNAAIRHFSIPPSTTFDDSKGALSRRAVAGAYDWKSFCRRQLRIEQSWLGKAPSSVTFHAATGRNVHRIKVDERRGFIITTASERDPGLRVVDMESGELVWSLPEGYVCSYAHCEYDEGYLIFNRGGTSSEKEVWRLVDDCVDGNESHATYAPPDEAQLRAAELQNSNPSYTRKFIPWALLKPPSSSVHRAFRFAFPTLIAASDSALSFWDVTSGDLLQTFAYSSDLGDLNYVEVSRQSAEDGGMAFVCGSLALRGFSPASGQCLLDIPSSQYSYANNSYTLEADGQAGWINSAVLKPQKIVHQYIPTSVVGNRRLLDKFIAVNVSECGAHLVALLATSRLLIIPFFQRVIDGHMTVREIALDVQLGSHCGASKYLAFENGRIGVATATGIYILTLDFESTLHAPAQIIATRAAWFTSTLPGLTSMSCLQLGPTSVYFNWSTSSPGRNGAKSVSGDDLEPGEYAEENYARWLDDWDTKRLPDGSEAVRMSMFARSPIYDYSSVVSIDLGGIVIPATAPAGSSSEGDDLLADRWHTDANGTLPPWHRDVERPIPTATHDSEASAVAQKDNERRATGPNGTPPPCIATSLRHNRPMEHQSRLQRTTHLAGVVHRFYMTGIF
ncbi:hypothetical protein C8F01DRAFT_1366925 [Mycena amicta]|nr:hypothetical protein C8F01DRAFT_1366925 [Mycena amicta]